MLKCENYTLENSRESIRYVTKIVHEWNCHLEMFSLSQAIENSRQFLHLRTDIGVTAEYQAILKLYPYSSGYVVAQVSLTLTLTLSGYEATQLRSYP